MLLPVFVSVSPSLFVCPSLPDTNLQRSLTNSRGYLFASGTFLCLKYLDFSRSKAHLNNGKNRGKLMHFKE
jgi:hypothetical protein